MTGYPAPMAIPEYKGTYDHMVARADGMIPQPPPGAIAEVTVFPWSLYRLPEPKTASELLGKGDFSKGIRDPGLRKTATGGGPPVRGRTS